MHSRKRMIASVCWIVIGAAASLVFKIAGNDQMTKAAAMSVCLIMLLYWISYVCLRRKY